MSADLFVIVFGRAVQIVLTLVSVRFFTTLLSSGEVGNLYLINSIVGFFGLALVNPVGMYINRKLHKWDKEETLLNHFFIFNLYLLVLSVVSIGIVFFAHNTLGIGSNIESSLLSLTIVISIFFGTWNQTIIPSLNMLNHRRTFVLFSVLTVATGLAFSIALTHVLAKTAIVWLIGQLIGQSIVAVTAFAYLLSVTQSHFDFGQAVKLIRRNNVTHLLLFAIPLGINTFFMWVQSQSYRITVERFVGLEYLALLGLGIGIAANIGVAIESIVQQICLPIYYSEINTDSKSARIAAWNKMASIALPAYFSGTLFVSLLAPFLVNLLAHQKFASAAIFVVYGAWLDFFRVTTNTLSSIAHSEMQTHYLMKAYFLGGLITATGVFLFSRATHLNGFIPGALLMGGLVTAMVMFFEMRRLLPFSFGRSLFFKTALSSLPFFFAVCFYSYSNYFWVSFFITLFFGLHFIFVQYLIRRPLLEKRP